MSRIFRSDEVQVGERVVVRRRVGDKASDIIGHVTSLEPFTVRPQERGGAPSSLPEVTVPAADIIIVKRLSPRRVRNSDIRHVEAAHAKAFPGIDHTWSSDGQWLLRAGDGVTERSNSATPLGASAGFTALPIGEILDFYARHRLPARLHIPERLGRAAEQLVAAEPHAWQLSPEILVMTRPLDDIDPHEPPNLPEGLSARVDDTLDDAWLALYHFRGQRLPVRALEWLQKDIDGTMGFARLLDATGATVAITRATLTTSDDGTHWLGYSAVEVADGWRRRGLGTALGRTVMAWGAAHGAQQAYLQVIGTNDAGIGLYGKLGFIEHHRHRYATRVAS
ncbi:N-acetylglutamate synthase, CG3035 family [Corynebacterium uterequi]|uniref:Acetyltransferase (GNAT) family protein n=1 Tax=Corynebacterium uterequi TaxID=1072256 RepID=A0A0G3HEY1_9CORY|nr:GNAT family N-acetyltransferase [Corynebacterium uterequi]AKK11906.1 acetyltransferase (GNAT) family protein [Corynebacterium uterequi]